MNFSAPETAVRKWNLERYARLTSVIIGKEIAQGKDGWECYDNKLEPLQMMVTSSCQLLIHHGRRQLESMFLQQCTNEVKGVSKGDSLLIVCNMKNHHRRFRVKFSADTDKGGKSGLENCHQCVVALSRHMQIKVPACADGVNGSRKVQDTLLGTPSKDVILDGDVTIGQIAEAMSSPSGPQLPAPYSALHSNGILGDLNTMVKMCLTDPAFPAFVGQVEKELEKLKKECI
ncbi:uncharacterized protein LOC127857882 [Dreissena polymorpha]|uniref:Uncharacterized protein n=1 Tax=Dreissena polymorpha TaxID=45954 RepID=A0A9D3Z3L3_DREPO|nr:uncharacterized protein LOC127857882 [Dreissena polymorpha]KAH3710005.1 hypothetical protein DPMN_069471 [Dreissena polymorpha]